MPPTHSKPPPDGDIELHEVVEKCGDKLCLIGNLQLKHLESDAPEEMEERVKKMVTIGKKAKGYIAMPTAAPINLPLSPVTEKNYIRFIDTAIKYGQF